MLVEVVVIDNQQEENTIQNREYAIGIPHTGSLIKTYFRLIVI